MRLSPQKVTPVKLARLWGVSASKVVGWIKSGELRAINGATRLGGRPRYLIDRADVASFEASRGVQARPAAIARRRRPQGQIIEFF